MGVICGTLALNRISKDTEFAAMNLGAKPLQVVLTILIPQLLPYFMISFLITFLLSWDEAQISWYSSGFDQTLPAIIRSRMSTRLDGQFFLLGLIFSIAALTVSWVLVRINER